MTITYGKRLKPDDHLLTVEEFHLDCDSYLFVDTDGYGEAVRGGMIRDDFVPIYPSTRHTFIPEDATHIVWYNK